MTQENDKVADSYLFGSEFSSDKLIKKSQAMTMLGFSRHTFDKCVKDGELNVIQKGKSNLFFKDEIKKFMQTNRFKELDKGTVDPRNTLNDLTGKA